MSICKKKTIYLHVGTTKTGSTTIQTFLCQNEELFRQRGFDVYTPRRVQAEDDRKRLRTLVHYFGRFSSQLPTADSLSGWIRQFLRILEESPAHSLILSEECLWNVIGATRKRVNFKQFICQLQCFAEVKIIVYLRRQDNYLMSGYQQRLKGGKMNGRTCTEWIQRHGVAERLDYRGCLQWLGSLVGQQNLTVRPFEPDQFVEASLISDFLSCVGLLSDEAFKCPIANRNPGLSPFLAEIIRCLSFFYCDKDYVFPFNELKKSNDARYFNFDRKHRFLSPAKRCEIMHQCADGNEWVARELLGRTDGVLFYEPLPDVNEPWSEYRLCKKEVKCFFDELTHISASQRAEMCRQVLGVCRGGLSRRFRLWHRMLR
jgi:hypothetical protein